MPITLEKQEFIPIPSEYFPQLPPEIKLRLLYRGCSDDTKYSMYQLAEICGVSTMHIRKVLKDLIGRGVEVQVTETPTLAGGNPLKLYWVEPI